jgi:hypothetical protein
MGADGFTALYQTSRRDKNSSEKERTTKKKSLEREETETKKVLEAIVKRIANFPDVPIVLEEGGGGGNVNTLVANNNTENGNNLADATTERYWEVGQWSADDKLILILRMFVPKGVLTKGTDAQLKVLEDSGVLAKLSKLSFDAKYEELMRRLPAIELELQKLNESEDETQDVNEDESDLQQ